MSAPIDRPIIPFPSQEAWEAWLSQQDMTSGGVWMKVGQKGLGYCLRDLCGGSGGCSMLRMDRRPSQEARRRLLPSAVHAEGSSRRRASWLGRRSIRSIEQPPLPPHKSRRQYPSPFWPTSSTLPLRSCPVARATPPTPPAKGTG